MPPRQKNSADDYDEASRIQAKCFNDLIEAIPQTWQPFTVLDIGCSTGKRTYELAIKFPHAKITGIDPLEDKIRFAKHNFRVISFEAISFMKFAPKTYDLIVANASLQWMVPLYDHLKKIEVCLNKDGIFIATIFGKNTFCELQTVLKQLGDNVQMPTHTFPSIENVIHAGNSVFKSMTFNQIQYKNKFNSLHDLLKSIRQTGTGGQHGRGLWTPGRLKKIEERYQLLYGGIYATYDIMLLQAKKGSHA